MKKFILKTFLIISLILLAACKNNSDDDDNIPASSTTSEITKTTGDKTYKSPVALPALANQSTNLSANWWKTSAFYHIWIKSFKDSDLDDCSKNCGDFRGIEDSLDYIQNDLGCDAIWLSPFWDCWYKGESNAESAKINMHGYDVNDFYKVNKFFGTGDGSNAEAELESLIAACHARGMKIIFDFVPNHTSHENQWFLDSSNGKNGKSNWYLWSNSPNNWKNTWGADAWHKKNGRYYYAAFANTQPDLNYRNLEVREEMKNVVRYWLNKGFDGLRIDAVRYLVETESSQTDTAGTHEWFQELRKVIDEYTSPKFMVCEAWLENDRTNLNKYFGTSEKPEFNMVLDFDQGKTCITDVGKWWDENLTSSLFTPAKSEWSYGTFLGNHDEYFNRIGDYESNLTNKGVHQATALSLLRPTVPFIYYGNEIAQKSGDENGDFSLRQPFDWTRATSQKNDESSLLNMNKALLTLRKSAEYKDLFANGKLNVLNCNMVVTTTKKPWKGAVAYTISNASQKLLVVANLTNNIQSALWFSDFGFSESNGYSLIMGNKDTDKSIYFKDYNTIFYNFAPHEIRVYDLKDSTKSCAFDIWDWSTATMYLRGTMNNNWGTTEMTLSGNEFKADVELTTGTVYEFKFDEFNDWTHSYGKPADSDGTVTQNTEFDTSD
ncbi:MAG: hypothetical protein IJP90_01110, partial [Treponema sp.]|nr:hypothetical protein [Treponema sp.]